MSESQHTPGPWKIVEGADKTYTIEAVEGHGTYICELLYETSHQQANARLIAAAPKLLSILCALERMSRGVDWCDSEEQARRWSEARTTINAVICIPAIVAGDSARA